MTKHERLVEALNLWVAVTGFDEDRRSFKLSGRLSEWAVHSMSEAIKEALDLDETNITGFLLLSYFSRHFIEHTHFKLNELLNEPERVESFVAQIKKLLSILNDKEMLEDLSHFQLVTRQAVRHYHADRDEVMALIEQQDDIAFLRRDALKSIQRLRVDHFLVGATEDESFKPVYNREVYQFWNINSMLQAVCKAPSGVSLNLIRTPDDYQSYFVFAIRNGGNVITLSDIAQHSHPLQAYMSRRPDKSFGKRIVQNWFPYDLMNYQYDEESGSLWIEKQDFGSAIAPLNQTAFPLSPIKDLKPEEIIWTTLMFELIVERFWRKPIEPAQLSYTGDMVKVEATLIEHAKQAGLPVVQYEGIQAKELTVQEIAYPDDAIRDAIGEFGGDHNQWMIDRYSAKVNPSLMNLMGSGDVTAYVTSRSNEMQLTSGDEFKRLTNGFFTDNDTRYYELHKLDTAGFGSKEQILADRAFIARHNLAREIKRLAYAEYTERKADVKKWYEERLAANVENLFALATQGEVWFDCSRDEATLGLGNHSRVGEDTARYRVAKLFDKEEYEKNLLYIHYDHTLSQGWLSSASCHACYVTGARSSFLLHLTPHTSRDLALLAGVEHSELPDVLQHWRAETRSRGNHILDRIDPIAWALRNPWERQSAFKAGIWLSKRALNNIQKTLHLPADRTTYRSYNDQWKGKDRQGFY
ncbi:hypothetical protein PZT57_30775 [Pseudomonas aeruginosa]|uniref:hypothetical protein n=1 Tax=Pseudomonas aeruginosa TaxID=287 RepID=UPI002B271761|nr:hypothetical protein [Pseudomonas aeruginosa]MEA8593034.1 hypothetical protein [Pseudomonas aeruginosa]